MTEKQGEWIVFFTGMTAWGVWTLVITGWFS